MSILDGQARSADVVALEPSRCLVLTSWGFKGMVSSHPTMALELLQESVRRLSTNADTFGMSGALRRLSSSALSFLTKLQFSVAVDSTGSDSFGRLVA